MLSSVLKDLLKTVEFLNSVQHCLSALVCNVICVLYEKPFSKERSFPAFVEEPSFSGDRLEKGSNRI